MNDQNLQNEEEGLQNQGESLNTGSAVPAQNQQKSNGGGLNTNLIDLAGGRSATDHVRSQLAGGNMGSTGTNISYEGPTAPGAGGSVGSGYASGQSAADTNTASEDADIIANTSGMGQVGKPGDKAEGDDDITDGGTQESRH